LIGAVAGSPPPRPKLGSTLRSVGSDYLLHHTHLEGYDFRDRGPVVGGLGFALRNLVGGRRSS
jgi:hypothetical protein